MIQHLLFVYGMNLKRAGRLVDDLTDEQMVAQPSGVINHPAWTLGHLGATSDALAGMLGLPSTFPDAWREACRTGSIPSGEAADYPGKAELLEQLRAQHQRVAEAVAAVDDERLQQPTPPRLRERFPTIGDFATALMTMHEGHHLGQLAAWRRALGLGAATG
jgi:uncharacterized damage-inducible protein DinB